MRGRAWLIPLALGVLVVALTLLVPNQPSTSPDHRSDSDAPDGTSALYELSSRLGHPTAPQKGSFNTPDGAGIMFVFSPDNPFDQHQAQQLVRWVRDGGTLVYADTAYDPMLSSAFKIQSSEAFVGTDSGGVEARITASAPVLDGVTSLTSAPDVVQVFEPNTDQVAALRTQVPSGRGARSVVGMVETVGKGRAFFLGDPLVLCNGFLAKGDDGVFAADLLAMAPGGAPVRFDEFHHGSAGTTASINDWATTPWGLALAWALVVVFGGFLLRGRAFGPAISITSRRDRSSAEYAAAVGTLLRRARAQELTAKVLSDATRRALADRTGLGRSVPPERVSAVLERRAPVLAGELGAADALAADVAGSESRLLRAARRLHALAYPSPKTR